MATKERREYEKYHEKFESEYHNFLGGVRDKYRTEWGMDTTHEYKAAYERDKYLKQKALDSERREYDNRNLQRDMSDYRHGNTSFQEESNAGAGYLIFVGVIFVAVFILAIVMFIIENWQFVFWLVSPFILLVILIKKKIFYLIERIGFFIGMLVCCWSQSFAAAIKSNGGLTDDSINFLAGILNSISFIACMFLFFTMGVPRLRKLYKKYLDPFRKEIKTKQLGIEYDPDSSPKAFEHYKRAYISSEFCSPIDKFDWLNVDTRNHLLNESYENAFERLYVKIQDDTMGLGDSFLLGGETDFNFNEQKSIYLMQILKQKKVRHKDVEKLQFCQNNYHSVVNFSLMPATGAMGNFKGSEKFDRLDCFICSLNEFYINGNYQVLSKAKGRNKEYLLNYLNLFDDIYDYCRKIYFMEDREFVDRIIMNGQKPLKSREDVVRYMNLAIDYWNRKESYLKNIK